MTTHPAHHAEPGEQAVSIARYNCGLGGAEHGDAYAEMSDDDDGDYVTYADHYDTIAQLTADLAAARAERDRSIERHEHTIYWYGCRIATLSDWFRAEARDLPIAKQYWNIIANGAKDPYAPETYAQQLNTMRHRAEAAECERDALRAAVAAADALRKCLHAGGGPTPVALAAKAYDTARALLGKP